ncbi:unnamed protein product [Tilletia controversa]|nr:unnamed protein product [Tilletia controversa]
MPFYLFFGKALVAAVSRRDSWRLEKLPSMPLAALSEEEVAQQVHADFRVVAGSLPIQVQCSVCAHEGSAPILYHRRRLIDAHIQTQKHKRNLRFSQLQRVRDEENDEDMREANAEEEEEAVDDGQQWIDEENEREFWQIANERQDILVDLYEEMAQICRGEEIRMHDQAPAFEGLAGPDNGDWKEFKNKKVSRVVRSNCSSSNRYEAEHSISTPPIPITKLHQIFSALSFLLSPRHCHSLATLELALGLAEAMGAINVPSINTCRKALAQIYTAGKETLVREVCEDKQIFWRASVETLLKEDFASPITRPKMHMLPRRGATIRELRDGDALAFNVDERTCAPMVRLANGQDVWIKEVYKHQDQLIRPEAFYENDEGTVMGEGRLVVQQAGYLELTDERINFVASNIDTSDQSRREIQRQSLHITGFEVCIGTPIEALHTWLLGPVKYLFASLARQVKKNTQHFQEVATRLSDANLGGTGLSSKLDGVYLLNNAGGLTGKDMRALAQVVWLAILPIKEAGVLPQSTWDAWRWAGVVTRLMLIEELPRDALDEYRASAE